MPSDASPSNWERIRAWPSEAGRHPGHRCPNGQRRPGRPPNPRRYRNVGGTGTYTVVLPTVPSHTMLFNMLHSQSSLSSEERIGHSEQETFDKIQGMLNEKTHQKHMGPQVLETRAEAEFDRAADGPGMGVDVAELGSDADLDEVDSDSDMESSEEESDVEPLDEVEDMKKRKEEREEMWLKLSPEKRHEIGLENAKRLLSAALDEHHEDERPVPKYRQKSLRVGILGAANAGKSSLTNCLVGRKVAAVSRKRNTTLSEILGSLTKGDTQILFYDTPGLVLDILGHPSKTDTRYRSEDAWQLRDHCEVLVVILDAYRQIMRPDKRVFRLVERFGKEECPHPKRILCLNKVDIIKRKSDLLPLATQIGNLPGYESVFMVSALTGSGVRQLEEFLLDQAVLRPWDEEPDVINEESLRTLSMEVVREHLLNYVHEEIPYELDHQLTGWEEQADGSLRIEQHFYLPKKGQCRILVGKGGCKIREIGIAACEELRQLMGRIVHLILEVKHVSRF